MNISLLQCTGEHLNELVWISRKTFEDAFSHMNDPRDFQTYMDSAFSIEAIEKELHDENMNYYFVYLDGGLAGYFKLNRGEGQTDIKDRESLEIERIYVLKEYQGRKLGQWMMNAIKELAEKEGADYLWLGVWEKNLNAIRFYEKHGFQKFGEHPYYIGKDKQTDWLMRYDIPTLQA